MSFIEIEAHARQTEWSMSDLQCHNYYELYFLLEGTRRFFLKDKVFNISAPTVCIIPPFCMHKTEGNAYRRININISAECLYAEEKAFLDSFGKNVLCKLDLKNAELFLNLLENVVVSMPTALNKGLLTDCAHVLLHLLQQDCLSPLHLQADFTHKKTSSIIIQIIEYIHKNFKKEFSIDDLCRLFFISKNSLCSQFRAWTHCSVMQYRQFIRISKAKELLASTQKGLDEIAEECGFSSTNYFSLIFKKEVGISPSNYRKSK